MQPSGGLQPAVRKPQRAGDASLRRHATRVVPSPDDERHCRGSRPTRPYAGVRARTWQVGFRRTEPSFFRSEEHTSELQSLMRISYAVFCLKKKTNKHINREMSTIR